MGTADRDFVTFGGLHVVDHHSHAVVQRNAFDKSFPSHHVPLRLAVHWVVVTSKASWLARWIVEHPSFVPEVRRIIGIMAEEPLARLGRIKEAIRLVASVVCRSERERPPHTPVVAAASAQRAWPMLRNGVHSEPAGLVCGCCMGCRSPRRPC